MLKLQGWQAYSIAYFRNRQSTADREAAPARSTQYKVLCRSLWMKDLPALFIPISFSTFVFCAGR